MSEKLDLTECRNQIDDLDRQIVELYEKRMDVCAQVAEYKIDNNRRVLDPKREQQKLAAVEGMVKNEAYAQCVHAVYEQIMALSRKQQYSIMGKRNGSGKLAFIPVPALTRDNTRNCRVVFQGAPGSYSQIAMHQFFGSDITSINVETFRDAMLTIDSGAADYAVLPIENSSAGIVTDLYDLLVEFENYIVGEQIIRVEHCLMAKPGAALDSIKTVYSHPQSLMQCESFLTRQGYEQISMKNNAFAAQKVAAENDLSHAAIASSAAAEAYGLEILERGVNDEKDNSTRFIIVTNQKVFPENARKISLCFEVNHTSGALYHALSHLIFNGLNMTKIESRPLEGRNWEYRFFLDFEGNLTDPAVKNALSGLREETHNLKILGNY